MTANNHLETVEWNRILTAIPMKQLSTDVAEALRERAARNDALPPVNMSDQYGITVTIDGTQHRVQTGSVLIFEHDPRLVIDVVGDTVILYQLAHDGYSVTYQDWLSEDIAEESLTIVAHIEPNK